MKLISLFTIVFYLFSLHSNAAPRLQEAVIVKDPQRRYLKKITQVGSLIVDHVNKQGYEVYGPKGTYQWLQRMGVNVQKEEHLHSRSGYPSYKEIVAKLKKLNEDFPKITRLFSIGKSVEGRDLLVMKISDNVEKDENEPEFKYISSMHGDEIVGRELMILFMRELLTKYKDGDAATKKLVDNTEIFILPSMNPDGSERPRRWNANGKDLNRDFPDFTTNDNVNSPKNRQPETQAIMKWQAKRNFALSANFHGGAVVMNYPWDTERSRHPLHPFVVKIAKHYAKTNLPMKNSTQFPGGIVNGYDWYEVNGGMQDWSYFWHNDLQFTVELSDIKYPDYSTIDKFYKDNRQSLFNMVKLVHSGAGVTFPNKNQKGTVKIRQITPKQRNLGSFNFNKGQFYKVLPNGEYLYEIETAGQTLRKKVVVNFPDFKKNGNYINL